MIKVKTIRRVTGMSQLAERFGVTRSHLWKVREGKTQSARLVAELESLGIKCKKYRGARSSNQGLDYNNIPRGE